MDTELFNRALGLVEPWIISGYDIDEDNERITFFVKPEENSLLTCPHCENSGVACNDYKFFEFDYLNFFKYKCSISVKVPLIRCSEHGEVCPDFYTTPNKYTTFRPFPSVLTNVSLQ